MKDYLRLLTSAKQENILQSPKIHVIIHQSIFEILEIFRAIESLRIEKSISNGYFFRSNDWIIFFDKIIIFVTKKACNCKVIFVFKIFLEELEVVGIEDQLLLYLCYLLIELVYFTFVAVIYLVSYTEFFPIDKDFFEFFIVADIEVYFDKGAESKLDCWYFAIFWWSYLDFLEEEYCLLEFKHPYLL